MRVRVRCLLESILGELETINMRISVIEHEVRRTSDAARNVKIEMQRFVPKTDKAIEAIRKAFYLTCNGILNLRLETSEFAGTIVNTEHDMQFI